MQYLLGLEIVANGLEANLLKLGWGQISQQIYFLQVPEFGFGGHDAFYISLKMCGLHRMSLK